MPFTENNGVKIYWEEEGKGAPLLLIMGLGWPSYMWYRTKPLVAEQYRTITFDNRGAGRSDVPAGPYSIAAMASDAAAVLDAAGVESAQRISRSKLVMIPHASHIYSTDQPEAAHKSVLEFLSAQNVHSASGAI